MLNPSSYHLKQHWLSAGWKLLDLPILPSCLNVALLDHDMHTPLPPGALVLNMECWHDKCFYHSPSPRTGFICESPWWRGWGYWWNMLGWLFHSEEHASSLLWHNCKMPSGRSGLSQAFSSSDVLWGSLVFSEFSQCTALHSQALGELCSFLNQRLCW